MGNNFRKYIVTLIILHNIIIVHENSKYLGQFIIRIFFIKKKNNDSR